MERVIEFLLALAGTRQTSRKSTIGHQKPNLPTMVLTSQQVRGYTLGGDTEKKILSSSDTIKIKNLFVKW